MKDFQIRAPNADAAVKSAHITAWNLQGVIPVQRWIVDLHLELTAGPNAPVTTLELILPFEVDSKQSIEDLSGYWNSLENALPEWIERTTTRRVVNAASAFRLNRDIEVDNRNSVPSPISRRSDVYSRIEIVLERVIPAGQSGRVILRFHAGPQLSFVLWKRSGFGLNGVLVDIKIAAEDPGHDILVPETTSIHVVVRAYLQPKFTYPAAVPSLVEQGAWLPYLRRDTDLRGEGALVRFSTRIQDEPGRLYLDLSREFGLLPLGNFIRFFFAAAFGAGLALFLRDDGGFLADAWDWFTGASTSSRLKVGPIVVGGAAAVIVFLIWKIPATRRFLRKARSRYKRWERWVLEQLQRPARRPS